METMRAMEILCKLYLELANVVPPDCKSARELKLEGALKRIFAHWDEFGPEHGFERIIDSSRDFLK
jgi:hypothetical protein